MPEREGELPSVALPTYVAPGQRYAPPGRIGGPDRAITVVHVGRDASGLAWVTYRGPDGLDVVGPVARFEAAVAAGELVPVATAGAIPRC